MELSGMAEEKGLGKPGAGTERIENFATAGMAEGHTPSQIKGVLLGKGQRAGTVNKALGNVGEDMDKLHGLAREHKVHTPSENIKNLKMRLSITKRAKNTEPTLTVTETGLFTVRLFAGSKARPRSSHQD